MAVAVSAAVAVAPLAAEVVANVAAAAPHLAEAEAALAVAAARPAHHPAAAVVTAPQAVLLIRLLDPHAQGVHRSAAPAAIAPSPAAAPEEMNLAVLAGLERRPRDLPVAIGTA